MVEGSGPVALDSIRDSGDSGARGDDLCVVVLLSALNNGEYPGNYKSNFLMLLKPVAFTMRLIIVHLTDLDMKLSTLHFHPPFGFCPWWF